MKIIIDFLVFHKENEKIESKATNDPNTNSVTDPNNFKPIITNKNIQGVKSLLKFTNKNVQIINTSWESILVTLQYLVSVLDLKPTTGGSLKSEHMCTELNAGMIAMNVLTDLQCLSAMITNLFESTKHLEQKGLSYLIDALISLSDKAMQSAYQNNVNRVSISIFLNMSCKCSFLGTFIISSRQVIRNWFNEHPSNRNHMVFINKSFIKSLQTFILEITRLGC